MKRDFRYIFRRVIAGILIGLFFIGFKSCEVHASGYISGNVNINYYYQNCEKKSLTLWQCGEHYFENVSGDISYSGDNPVIQSHLDNTDNDIILTRVIYTFNFSSPLEVGSNCSNYFCNIRLTGSGSNLFFDSRNDTYVQLNNSLPHTNASSFNNFFVNTPYENLLSYHLYYAEYYDSDLEEWKPLKVTLNTSSYLRASNWTNGQHISALRFHLGSPADINYMEAGVSTSNPYVPVLPRYYEYIIDKYNESKYSNYQLFALANPTWVNSSNSSIFPIAFYPKGVNISTKSYTRRSYSLFYSNNDSGNTPNYNFTQTSYNDIVSNSQQNVDNLTNTIENSISNSETQEMIGTSFEDGGEQTYTGWLNYFTDFSNDYGSKYTGLFSALFVRPLQLLTNQAGIDLVNPNTIGNLVLDRRICNENAGVGNVSLPGSTNYEIELWHGYKFELPCMHVDVYPLLKHTPYAFYGSTFLGVDIAGHGQVQYSFAYIWLLLQHGFLVYLLFVSILNTYKYMVDINNTEVEVLEL